MGSMCCYFRVLYSAKLGAPTNLQAVLNDCTPTTSCVGRCEVAMCPATVSTARSIFYVEKSMLNTLLRIGSFFPSCVATFECCILPDWVLQLMCRYMYGLILR